MKSTHDSSDQAGWNEGELSGVRPAALLLFFFGREVHALPCQEPDPEEDGGKSNEEDQRKIH